MANLRGWQAVLVAILVVGGAGFRAFYRTSDATKTYREFQSGTWNIPAEQAWLYELKATRDLKIRVELSRTTPGPLFVFLVDAANHRKLLAKGPGQGADDVNLLFKSVGQPTVLLDDFTLSTGDYFLHVENDEAVPIAVNFKISEFR